MLLPMNTLTPGDHAHWDTLTRYDHAIGQSLQPLVDQAITHIRQFHAANPGCVCATSWGKDSVAVAWLTRMANPNIPIIWVPTLRADGVSYEAEATYSVRDEFHRLFPGAYEERPATARNPKRGDPNYNPTQFDQPGYKSQDVLKENIPEPSINGVRAEESIMRAKSAKWHGINSKHASRPILKWTAPQIFALLHTRGLPTHPAYAATQSGFFDRAWLRVHPLRSKAPASSTVYGWNMDDWEDHYFPELIPHKPTDTSY